MTNVRLSLLNRVLWWAELVTLAQTLSLAVSDLLFVLGSSILHMFLFICAEGIWDVSLQWTVCAVTLRPESEGRKDLWPVVLGKPGALAQQQIVSLGQSKNRESDKLFLL